MFTSNTACIEVESARFTDELMSPAAVAYSAVGLPDKDLFSSRAVRVPDSRFETDEGSGPSRVHGPRLLRAAQHFP